MSPERLNSLRGDVQSGSIAIPETFLIQSYLDSTALSKAVLKQNPGDSIVSSTLKLSQQRGYGFTLAPWSKTPVAIEARFGGNSGQGSTIILAPGETTRFGQSFEGFKWGLPFGWLGGGDAILFVHQSPEARMEFQGHGREILFHRQRMKINAAAVDPDTVVIANWPTMFPSQTTTASLGGSVLQAGRPFLTVKPTRTMLRLRLSPLLGPLEMRALLYGTEGFDTDSTGAYANTNPSYLDVVWPVNTEIGATPSDQFNVKTYTDGILVDLGCDGSNVAIGGLVLMAIDAALADVYVDILRFGKI